ncbi:MAG: hypothetical protein K8H88_32970 [Sandaracinaceae bacterium]|nr:hypothetical protein [Sandaracinaceae bacterium]
MLSETLGSVLSPDRIELVLDAVGWSIEHDRPHDASLSAAAFASGPLRALLTEVLDAEVAGLLSDEIVAMLPMEGERVAPTSSGIRPGPARPRATIVPEGGERIAVLSRDRSVAAALELQLPFVLVIAVDDAATLARRTADLHADVIVIDRRRGHACELAGVDPAVLTGVTAVIWGAPQAYAPELEGALSMASRRISCSGDATARDIGALCAALGGSRLIHKTA